MRGGIVETRKRGSIRKRAEPARRALQTEKPALRN